MFKKTLVSLIVTAVIFSLLSVLSGTGLQSVTGGTSQELNHIPNIFSLITVILIVAILLLILIDMIILMRKK